MKRILVVEDDADIRNLLAYRLRRVGYDVVVADDGVAALAAVQDVTPDVVLLDWVMPRMSGLEVCRELRSQARFAKTGIFFVTANSDATDRLLGLDAGATGYIFKPFKISEIVERVQRYIARPQLAGFLAAASS